MIELPLIILGTGGAGMAASIYALRYRIDHVLLGELPGGTLTTAHLVENYPGYSSILGNDLVDKFVDHVKYLGGKITHGKATKIERNFAPPAGGAGERSETEGSSFIVTTDKETYRSKTLIYTLGSTHKHLGVPGEKEFDGKGVSYCATCDGFFFRDKTVAVVGGGDSAATGALVLGGLAKKTYMLVRGDRLKAEPIWVEQLQANPKVEIVTNTSVTEIGGSTKVEWVKLNKPHEGSDTLALDGIFVEVGLNPASELSSSIGVEMDAAGFIKVGEDMSTNVPGFFAAGDVTTGSAYFRQLVTAASEGVIATYGAYQYLNKA